MGYEAIGVIDASLKTVAIFARSSSSGQGKDDKEAQVESESKEETAAVQENSKSNPEDEFDKGVVLYLRGERIVGILLWNVFNRINIARKVIAEDLRTTDYDEVAKLFNIYEGQQE